MNLAAFRVRFPEFDAVADALVQARLDDALLELDSNDWGDLLDQGQSYLAAHKLALSPYGQQARLAVNFETTYHKHFEKLKRQVTVAAIVT